MCSLRTVPLYYDCKTAEVAGNNIRQLENADAFSGSDKIIFSVPIFCLLFCKRGAFS